MAEKIEENIHLPPIYDELIAHAGSNVWANKSKLISSLESSLWGVLLTRALYHLLWQSAIYFRDYVDKLALACDLSDKSDDDDNNDDDDVCVVWSYRHFDRHLILSPLQVIIKREQIIDNTTNWFQPRIEFSEPRFYDQPFP